MKFPFTGRSRNNMHFGVVLQARHSCRSYSPTPLTNGELSRIWYAISTSPSAGNLRSFEYETVTEREKIDELAYAAGQPFIGQAPCVFVFFATEKNIQKYGHRGFYLYSIQDASAAVTIAHLAATDLGLGSCWIGAFDDRLVNKIMNKPDYLRPVAMLTVGHEK